MGKKVLIIDADIRKSNYVKRFQVTQKVAGLSQYLSGQDAEEVLAILRRQDAREAAGEKDVYAPGSYCIWTHEFERVLEMVKRLSLSTFSLQQG